MFICVFLCVFFKQNTAYEMRISDWSSDLCSSDLEHAAELDAFCDFAARANPKRGFLIVSKVLGRHLPASPNAIRGAMDELGQKLPADLPGPIVFLGMAETATALGQGVFAAYLDRSEERRVGKECGGKFRSR